MRHPRVCLAAVALLAAGGCIERRETLTVEPDGSVLIELDFNAMSQGELYEGDAVPEPAEPWLVEEWTEPDHEGNPRYRLRAEGLFEPDEPLPETYAARDDLRAETCLQFPTTLTVEPRLDGVYYHLHREYPARPWAQVEALRELLVDERLEALGDKDDGAMTPDERAIVVGAFIDFELAKMLAFAREAFLEVSPEVPQDRWLALEARIRAHRDRLSVDRIAEFMGLEDESQREEALAEEARRFEAEASKALDTALREEAGYGGARLRAFRRRLEILERSHEITAELADDAFEITINMPGEIVGSNADAVSGNRATWRFGGERFRDRSLELMVSSRLR